MANPFVHVELNSTDLETARAFYTALFDWKLQDMPLPDGPGTYTTIDVGEGTGGGMMAQMMPGAGSAWMPYVLVEDIRAGTDKAAFAGRAGAEGRHRSARHGLAEHHPRPDRRPARVVEADGPVATPPGLGAERPGPLVHPRAGASGGALRLAPEAGRPDPAAGSAG